MKSRIINTLIQFSDESSKSDPPEMLVQIASELNSDTHKLHLKSRSILEYLLHHYSQLSVETIDHFNHRLIRTFARDLKLSSNFEVSLNTKELISDAVDKLISQAGSDALITKMLVDFALQKTDEDKSWDISRDINKASELLLNENDLIHLNKLKDKSLSHFIEFQTQIKETVYALTSRTKQLGSQGLELIASNGLDRDHFNRGSFFDFLVKLSNEDFNVSLNTLWQANLGVKPLYAVSKIKGAITEVINSIESELIEIFNESKENILKLQLLKAVLKNLTPLSVINLVRREFELIKEEQNLVPISDFNALIFDEIKDQPAPFIYERLGDKYHHFFIDEFQDTSLMQWHNLIPLIDNALAQTNQDGDQGTLLLVGDAKQSIYRWRGGLPEQFIDLTNDTNPFSTEKKQESLENNFRSLPEIVDFNNEFFGHVSSYFGNETHSEIYQRGNTQKTVHTEGGYVKIEFIPNQNTEQNHLEYASMVIQTIDELKKDEFQLSDICILVRSKRDGFELSKALMEANIPITAPESLLLDNSQIVQGLIHALSLSLFQDNEEAKIGWLEFIYRYAEIPLEEHDFYSELLKVPILSIDESLRKYDLRFRFDELSTLSLFDSFEYILRSMSLENLSDAFVFGFMDLVFEYQQKHDGGKIEFLQYWSEQKEKASVPLSENINSVLLMTIHKSKGLEFPVVIFPYADKDIRPTKNNHVWYPWQMDEFEEVMVDFKRELQNYGPAGEELYEEYSETLELDNVNLLYVTFTRAIERLYIFGQRPKKISDTPRKYYDLLASFLDYKQKWNDDQSTYEFGTKEIRSPITKSILFKTEPLNYISKAPEDSKLIIIESTPEKWKTEVSEAVTLGNLLHDSMSRIKTSSETESEFEKIAAIDTLSSEEKQLLNILISQIVGHPQLENLFSSDDLIYTEREIWSEDSVALRPDRINIHADNSATVIDYKTGIPREEHEYQINDYSKAIEQMGYIVKQKLLVYSNEDGILVNKL